MKEKDSVKKEIKRVIEEFSLNGLTEILEENSTDIIADIFYSFVDISKNSKISLSRIYQKLDDKLNNQYKKEISLGELSWEEFLNHIYEWVSNYDTQAYVVISSMENTEEDYSVIYQGSVRDIYKLLFEGVPLGNNGDFTIVSIDYSWLIYYDDYNEILSYISEN